MANFTADTIEKIQTLLKHHDQEVVEQGLMLLDARADFESDMRTTLGYQEGIKSAGLLREASKESGFRDIVFLKAIALLLEFKVGWVLAIHKLSLNRSDLKTLDSLPALPQLQELDLSGSRSLDNVGGLSSCLQLQELDLGRCKSLENVDGLANCTEIEEPVLSECESLENVDGLSNCAGLETLHLDWQRVNVGWNSRSVVPPEGLDGLACKVNVSRSNPPFKVYRKD